MRYLFQLSNISNFVLHRIHANVKEYLKLSKNLVFKWRQPFDKNGKYDSLIHVLPGSHYDIPNTCGDSRIVCCTFDFARLSKNSCEITQPEPINSENVHEMSKLLTQQYRNLASNFQSDHILVPLGDDFRMTDLQEWTNQYENYMRLFKHINSDTYFNMDVKFSTFREYFESVSNSTNTNNLKTLEGDFFPYQDNMELEIWTGYFTSRPALKKLERQLQAMIRATDICLSFVMFEEKRDKNWLLKQFEGLQKARRQLALFQHHDAITGTCRQNVIEDYEKRLFDGLSSASSILSNSLSALIVEPEKDKNGPKLIWTEVNFDTIHSHIPEPHVIELAHDQIRVLSIYNSLPFKRIEIISVLINRPNVNLADSFGRSIIFQINPYIYFNGTISSRIFELLIAVNLFPLGITHYFIKFLGDAKSSNLASVYLSPEMHENHNFPSPFIVKKFADFPKLFLKNGFLTTIHNKSSGFLEEIKSKNEKFDAKINFFGYESHGGAYILRPNKDALIAMSVSCQVYMIKGPLRHEIHSISEYIYHKEFLSKLDSDRIALEIENIVDISEISDSIDVIMKIDTNIQNKNIFYTDSNGFQLMKREYNENFPFESNYYPISSSFIVEDKKIRATLLTSQPHGATSLKSGQIEVMLERKSDIDDKKAVGVSINVTKPAKSNFRLVLEKDEWSFGQMAHSIDTIQESHGLLYRPVIFHKVSPVLKKENFTDFFPLRGNFPCDFHLLNIRSLNEDEFILILHRLHSNCNKKGKGSHVCRFDDTGLDELVKKLHLRHNFQPCTLSGILDTLIDNYTVDYRKMSISEIKSFCFGCNCID